MKTQQQINQEDMEAVAFIERHRRKSDADGWVTALRVFYHALDKKAFVSRVCRLMLSSS